MKLINKKNDVCFVEFTDDGEIIFCNELIQKGFKTSGIFVPPAYREMFDNLTEIPLDHPRFREAFVKLYYPFSMDHHKYVWQL